MSTALPTGAAAEKDKYPIVVVGAGEEMSVCFWCSKFQLVAGAGGLTVANQIYDRFKAAGKPLNKDDIAVIDGADFHYYQVCSQTHLLHLDSLTSACCSPDG